MLARGISLAEVLISILILIVGIVSIYSVFSSFSEMSKNRFLHMCLVEATAFALKACAEGASPPNTFQCGNLVLNVSAQGCEVPSQSCGVVSAEARLGEVSYALQQTVCNLREE